MSKHGLASLGMKVLRSLDVLNRCIRLYVFAINQLQRGGKKKKKNSPTAFGGMRSRCRTLIQQLPAHKLEQRDQWAPAVKNSSSLVLNLCTRDYWLTLSLSFFFFLRFTFNLPWSHELFISAFQILKACINFIYHLQKQNCKLSHILICAGVSLGRRQ